MGVLRSLTNSSISIANDYATVSNVREAVYKKKLEIIKTPMVREIVEATFSGAFLPRSIIINKDCIIARVYDAKSNTYHPNGIVVYSPNVTFDYYFAMALLLVFQDLYPKVYEINRTTTAELSEDLQCGTWQGVLTMNEDFLFKSINPTFDISNISSVPTEALPLTLEDNYTKGTLGISKVSLTLGIIALAATIISFGSFSVITGTMALAAFITGLITLFSSDKDKKKKKQAIWGIVLSIASWIIPVLVSIIALIINFELIFQ